MSNAQSNFDLTDPTVVVRLMAGLFYIPHVLFKVMGFAGAAGAFGKMGFNPPEFWVTLAIITEIVCAIGLTLNIYTRYVGLASAGTMALAVYGTIMAKGAMWMWNFGGVEYLVFWGVASLALAVQAWKKILATRTGASLLFAVA